mmetsp:Transcript_11782/g.22047  ORF Transcript_11782/g.22047 Transcript_11782/m.22047 type:complete len:781 (+) Transcript_11782:107-2449(+)
MVEYFSSIIKSQDNHHKNGHYYNYVSIQNAFLAGAVSASFLWSFVSWSMKQFKQKNRSLESEPSKRDADVKGGGLEEDDDENTLPYSIPYNPWKTKQVDVQYKQLLELREALIEHSKRTSLLMLDKILHQSQQFLGESKGKKRLRWPWESLRRHLSNKNLYPTMGSEKDMVNRNQSDMAQHELGSGLNNMSCGHQQRHFSLQSSFSSSTSSSSGASRSLDDMNHHSSETIEEEKEICIGSIFGLDVGGTLSKLVYFEKKRNVSTTVSRSPISYRKSRSAFQNSDVHPKWDMCSHDRQNESYCHVELGKDDPIRGHGRTVSEFSHFHESCSEDDLQRTTYPLHLSYSSQQDSSMKRSHSLFDLTSKKAKREKALDRVYEFARRLDTYDTDVKDKNLSFYSRALGGEVHFLQFETRFLPQAMDLIRINDLHLNISKMGATGGGAHKYAEKWEQMLGIEIVRQDELDSLVAGMQFILSDVVGECYTFVPKDTESKMKKYHCRDEDDAQKLPKQAQPFRLDEENETSDKNYVLEDKTCKENKNLDQYWWSRKVKRDLVATSDSYPYLLVMIGTGVSVLRVDGPRRHERISGSTIGGGTYWGLCRLLTDVEDFESVLNLAEKGDPSKVDMMVGDIYGEDSNALDKLGLTADVVASSFGKLVAKHDPAAGLKQEDLARALLLMVTNNIGQVAYLNAQLHDTKNIYFVGNFLRHNIISQQRLSYAINYWSRGKMEALFLEHEGYFGALGAFLLHQGISANKDGKVAQLKFEKKLCNSKRTKKRSVSF